MGPADRGGVARKGVAVKHECTCDWENGRYVVHVPPHAARRFRELFKTVRAHTRPPYHVPDRPDMARDLAWFFDRYPAELTPAARERMVAGEVRWHADRERLAAIVSGDFLPPTPKGFREGRAPYAYQARAAELAKATGRLLLLDDVGLGKTVSAIAMLADGERLPAVIVVPAHVSGQWIEEYIRVFTRLAAHEVTTREPGPLPPADIYVFRYSNLSGWIDHADAIGHKAIVFDEVQELRHGQDTAKGRAARAFADAASVELRVGLTATPIYNYGSEMFAVVDLVAPGALGSWSDFQLEWCRPHGSHWVISEPDLLGDWLRSESIALRRTERDEEVASALPPLNKVMVEVDWHDGADMDSLEVRRRLAERVLGGRFHEAGQAARELDMMMRHDTGVAKARAVAEYVRLLAEQGERVLVAGWHRDVYDIWNEALKDLRPVMYTGSETTLAKRKAKADFIAGRSRVMIMSLRSGAGTDGLQDVCAHVVIGEFDWSPQVHQQLIGRLRRPGQKRQVTAHYLWTDGGSDPVVMEMNGLKASQSHSILDPWQQPSEAEADASRVKALAAAVLGVERDKAPDGLSPAQAAMFEALLDAGGDWVSARGFTDSPSLVESHFQGLKAKAAPRLAARLERKPGWYRLRPLVEREAAA